MDEKEILEAVEDVRKIGASVDEIRKTQADFEKRVGSVPADIKEAETRILKEFAEKYADLTRLESIAKRVDELDATFQRALLNEHEQNDGKPSEHRKLIFLRLQTFSDDQKVATAASQEYRERVAKLEDLELRTMLESVGASGGIFVDPVTEAEILKNVVDIDPVRSIARVTAIAGSDRYKGYRRSGTPTAYWDTEIGSGEFSEPTYTELEIPVHGLNAKTPISSDLLADVSFMEAEITEEAGIQFDYGEGYAFVLGTGVGRPMGFALATKIGTDDAIYPASVASTAAPATNAIAADDIPKMWGTLKAPYRANATWVFNSNTLISLLKLKDANDRYLLSVDGGLVAGPPTTLYGKPFVICESLASEGSDVWPLFFGDFRVGYRIIDRSGIALLRDVYTNYPRVDFKWRKRVGGQVVKAEAIKALKTT